MAKCPVCETEYTPNEVETCSVCGYDLTPYPPVIGGIPSGFLEKEKKRIAAAKRVWQLSQSQVESAQLMVSHLQSQLDEMTRKIDGFTTTQSRLESQNEAIASQSLSRLESQVKAIASQSLSRLESQVKAIASQSQSLSRLESQIEAITSQLQCQSSQVKAIASQSQSLSRLESQVKAIASQSQSLSRLESQIEAIASQSQSLSRLESQVEAIASQSQSLSWLESQVKAIASQSQSRLESQIEAIASQSQSLSWLESQVKAIASQLQCQSSQIEAIASQSQSRLESQIEAIASQSQSRLESQIEAIASQSQSRLESQIEAIASQSQSRLESQIEAIASQLQSITEAVADTTIVSSSGFLYTELDRLLKSGNWKAADEETAKMMLAVAGKTSRRYLDDDDIKNFPGEDLRIIDGLWVKHSRGRFGFSVQKQIYINCGGLPVGNYPGDTAWCQFCDEVAWRYNGDYVVWSDCTFSATAPRGHLPSYTGHYSTFTSLLSRTDLLTFNI
ncbi:MULTISPECIES: GUN4 domain-containing protein [Limnospira]|uniref:GUN4 domain protein n=2 Tax=Limnospira TaxID=2596745 RepID=B5VVK7_LIMMA|nr:GUN4 domain protein [Limnospira maxima CS-328]UWU47953.1 GUN4-like [Arthrospira platensis C1]